MIISCCEQAASNLAVSLVSLGLQIKHADLKGDQLMVIITLITIIITIIIIACN